MGSLTGKSVLVVGASRGIGYAVAERLAGAGAWVAMASRGREALEEAARKAGGHPFAADVATELGVDELKQSLADHLGAAPDAVVNCAGSFLIAPLAATAIDAFDHQIAVNLRAPFLVIRAFLPDMLARRSGHVVNVGSVAGRVALPGNAAYGASKFGLRGMHEVLAAELRGTGVRATLVEPSATDTTLWAPLDPDSRDDLPSRAQMLNPDDVARAIVFALEQPPGVEVTHLAVQAAG